MKTHSSATICYVFVVILSWIAISMSIDTLTLSQSITSNETLVSANKEFQLGFFSPGNSKKFYLAIWFYTGPDRTVWIANRDNPLSNTSGVLRIGNDGNLILLDSAQRIIWSTGVQNLSSGSTVAQLLDTGNLVLRLRDSGEESFLWQSFDHPTDVLIAGMKLGWDLRTGLNRNTTSWKGPDDPSPGEYTFAIDLQGLPQIVVVRRGSSKTYRTGPWNGANWGGLSYESKSYITETTVNSEEVYYEHRLLDKSTAVMGVIDYSGNGQFYFRDNSNVWHQSFVVAQEYCRYYNHCGPNAICNIGDSPVCSCMIGYKLKNQRDWDTLIWSGGCIRENSFNCSEKALFKELEDVRMPDFLWYRVNLSMSLGECEAECSKNCLCTAYANANATGAGQGCLLWFGDLIDVRKLTVRLNQRLYVRVTAAGLASESDSKPKTMVIIVVLIASSILLLLVVLFIIWKAKSRQEAWSTGRRQRSQEKDKEDLQLPSFDMVTIARATQNFSSANKIGEGGFGPVYKGILPTGQEIAVKRLWEGSRQGLNEFKNEVMLIAKLQHRNLVRLLGYCIHGEERMLIYEYMLNGSLDSYIFDGSSSTNNHLFVWRKRFAIIVGIAKGLLYLHRDSRLKIIHRDLKASNVLLDNEMNPKISDFGLARTFGEEQSTVRTQMVVGTYGYMAPEYAIYGIYSLKSDVFSFGVLVLEIVHGKRNSQFYHPEHNFNLLGHAWNLWLDGRGSDLIDPLMEDSFSMSEVLRCIQVGLMCVQQRPEDRPTMSYVFLMLDSESANLPQPKRPGYYTERSPKSDSLLERRLDTTNDLTNSLMEGR